MPIDYSRWEKIKEPHDRNEVEVNVIGNVQSFSLPERHPLNNKNLDEEHRQKIADRMGCALKRVATLQEKYDKEIDASKKKDLKEELEIAVSTFMDLFNQTDGFPDTEDGSLCQTVKDFTRIYKDPNQTFEMKPLNAADKEKLYKVYLANEEKYLRFCQIKDYREVVSFLENNLDLFCSRTTDILLSLAVSYGRAAEIENLETTLKQAIRMFYILGAVSCLSVSRSQLKMFMLTFLYHLEILWKEKGGKEYKTFELLKELMLKGTTDGPGPSNRS